jgi:hypothetical protein
VAGREPTLEEVVMGYLASTRTPDAARRAFEPLEVVA